MTLDILIYNATNPDKNPIPSLGLAKSLLSAHSILAHLRTMPANPYLFLIGLIPTMKASEVSEVLSLGVFLSF